jgi:Flp pilus assembly protein protease CpaA
MIKDLLLLTIFPGAMALAAATDLFTMTVPNRIALVLVAGFLVAAPLVGLGWPEIGLHFGLAVAALVVTFTLFSFGWIGGGDAKLFAATCLWVGPAALLSYSVFSALIRRCADLGAPFLARRAAPGDAHLAKLAGSVARPQGGRALWHRARRGRIARLSANPLHGRTRRLTSSFLPAQVDAGRA